MFSTKNLASFSLLVMLLGACSKQRGPAGPADAGIKAGGAAGTAFPPIHVVREKLPFDREGHVHNLREAQRKCFESKEFEKNGGQIVKVADDQLIAKEVLMKDLWRDVEEEFFDGRKYAKLEESTRTTLSTASCQFNVVKQRSAEYVNDCARTSINYANKEITKSLDTAQAICATQAGAPTKVDKPQPPPQGEIKDLLSVGAKCILVGSGASAVASKPKRTKEEVHAIAERAAAGDKQAEKQLDEVVTESLVAYLDGPGLPPGYPCTHAQYPYYPPLGNRPVVLGWYPNVVWAQPVKNEPMERHIFASTKPNFNLGVKRNEVFITEPKIVEVGKSIAADRFSVPSDTTGFTEK